MQLIVVAGASGVFNGASRGIPAEFSDYSMPKVPDSPSEPISSIIFQEGVGIIKA
jgi:hypothetical protein